MDLVAKLKELQGDKTQEQFAAELGVTQAALSLIYSRKKNIGIEVARKIVTRYPHLRMDVVSFLLGENMTIVVAG